MAKVDLTGIAISIIILGIVTTIGVVIMIGIRDNRLTNLPIITTTNETLTSVTETGELLSKGWVTGVTSCVNATGGQTIATGNYTLTTENTNFGTATIKSTGNSYNNTNWKCTYTSYNTSQADWTTANQTAVGLSEYGNWFRILVIVGVAALVLGIIFKVFTGSSNDSNIGSGDSSSNVSY